jgi:hypothetical protein
MKKFFISVALLAGIFSYSAQAADGDKVSRHIQNALEKEFAGANSISWEVLDNSIYQATFHYNEQLLNAFFDQDGNLVATGRDIKENVMPLLVYRAIKEKYHDYAITDVVELTTQGETSYILTLENEKTKLIVRAYDAGTINVFKKEKKNPTAKL